MTKAELDVLWNRALREALEAGEEFTRYRFAAMVASAKEAEHKEAMRWDIHSCGPTCKRYVCVATREAVAAEREACARICETEWSTTQEHVHGLALADMIRDKAKP